jgi:hypothetical protein
MKASNKSRTGRLMMLASRGQAKGAKGYARTVVSSGGARSRGPSTRCARTPEIWAETAAPISLLHPAGH